MGNIFKEAGKRITGGAKTATDAIGKGATGVVTTATEAIGEGITGPGTKFADVIGGGVTGGFTKVADAAAEAQRKLREETERAAREAEQKLREEAERLDRQAKEAAAEAERMARTVAESTLKEVEVAKNNISDAINHGATTLNPKDVAKVLDYFTDNIPPEITEKGKAYIAKIDEIKQQIEQLQDALDINKLKRDILRKAEQFCEEYLKEKLSFLTTIDLNGVPKVHLDFNGKQISADINVFILLKDTEESNFDKDWLVLLSTNIVQEITKLVLPDIVVKLEPNKNILNNKLDEIKKEIEARKEELIARLMMDILQDYLPPLRALNEAIKIFG